MLPNKAHSNQQAVRQLSNAELLEILYQDKQDASSTATAQPISNDLDSQEDDYLLQTSSLLSPRISRLLQSPLTDPGLVAAQIRHKAVKPLPSGDRSPFQLKLQKNSYAIALATPPRLCVLTGLRLPSYFQIPFGVATHPKTGAPWHLPKLSVQAMSNSGGDEIPDGNPKESSSSRLKPDTSTTLKSPTRTLSSTHFLGSRQVLAHISSLTPLHYKRLMPYRWRQDPSVKLPEIVWREDMDTFVLDVLRRNVSKTLSYLASRPAAYVAPCKDYDSINKHGQVAAVLWLRRDADTSIHDESLTGVATSFDVRQTGPPPYAMHYRKTRPIPYYNLAALLGPNQLSALRESRPDHYGDHFAVVKLKRTTVKVQLELWKLLGYIAHEGEFG
ncbi:MAG: hypothetical protein ASARMPREDX12_003033 [Alectoria sarmentosa]|nr:MAG: hypothetical protein ASARMPREDX12_003033 [Alectoria sarmentosa]CAD6588578.1 MAG: hypothetical protein ASARMPRED_003603 [Alectoria sarmentosa]